MTKLIDATHEARNRRRPSSATVRMPLCRYLTVAVLVTLLALASGAPTTAVR